MKKYIISAVLLASISTGFAQSTPSGSATDASKDAGTSIASILRGAAPVITNGELQRNGDSAQLQRNSSQSLSSQMDYFQGVSGVSGATAVGTGRDGTIGATAGTSTFVDFSCKSEAASRKSSGGYVFQLQGCTLSGSVVQSVKLQVCSALIKGGSCAEAASFGTPLSLKSQTFVTQDNIQLGLGCNDTTATCRLTVKSSYSMATRTADYEQTLQAKSSAASGDTNTAQTALLAMRTKTNDQGANVYDAALASDGKGMVDCAKTNSQRTAAGLPALTCDGQQSAQVTQTSTTGSTAAASGPAPDCNTKGICVRTAVKTSSFTRSCTRTYPLTSQICEMETKTKSCDITWVTIPATQAELDAYAASVAAAKAAGNPAPGPMVLAKKEQSSCTDSDISGASKFNSAQGPCADDGALTSCQHYNRTEYYAWPPKATGTCYGDPYKVGGTCNTNAAQVDSQCPAGNWFGRTRPDVECALAVTGQPGQLLQTLQVGENVIAGCGVCPLSKTGTVCYAATPLQRDPLSISEVDRQSGALATTEQADNCATMDLNGCSLSNSDQLINNEAGMVTARRDNYTCTVQSESCLEYKQDDRCSTTTVNTFGIEKAGTRAAASPESMNAALASTAVLNSVGSAASSGTVASDGTNVVPLLFGGVASDCAKPTGSWGSNGYYQDCCRISLERPEKQLGKVNECNEDDARLAAARRANYTVFIGSECSKRTPWPLKKCIQERQVYCAFQGVLPRIIQEQGRKQLADLTQSSVGVSSVKAPLTFAYYGTTGTWTAPVSANGLLVAAWQWPAYCKDLSEAAKALSVNAAAKDCPTRLTNYFAVCEKSNGCGALPEYPELGSESWKLTTADPLQPITTAVSKYATVTGACDPGSSQCSYEVSAWPAGVGGRAVVTKQVAFPVYVNATAEAKGDLANIGDFMFQPVSTGVADAVFPNTLPLTVRLNFSSNGGQSWLPLDIPTGNNKELALPGSDAKLSGSCNLSSNQCSFTMTGTATVTAMSWGTVANPNCSGFTPGQLSVLDFGKMDLTEWLSTVAANVQGTNTDTLVASAATQMTQYNQNFQSNTASTVSLNAPQGVQFAKITPPEGFGPFTSVLKVGGYWPVTYGDPAKDTDLVTSVLVDWGDCTGSSTASFVSNVGGQAARGFESSHTFQNPSQVSAACGGGQLNLTHTVRLTVSTSKSGNHTVDIQVKNAYSTMSGAKQLNTGGAVTNTPTTTISVPASTVPHN